MVSNPPPIVYFKLTVIISPFLTLNSLVGIIKGGFNMGVGPQMVLDVISVNVVIFTPFKIPFLIILNFKSKSAQGFIGFLNHIY